MCISTWPVQELETCILELSMIVPHTSNDSHKNVLDDVLCIDGSIVYLQRLLRKHRLSSLQHRSKNSCSIDYKDRTGEMQSRIFNWFLANFSVLFLTYLIYSLLITKM